MFRTLFVAMATWFWNGLWTPVTAQQVVGIITGMVGLDGGEFSPSIFPSLTAIAERFGMHLLLKMRTSCPEKKFLLSDATQFLITIHTGDNTLNGYQ